MDAPTTAPGRTTIEVPTGLDRDELFHLLGDERRRRTVRYLLEEDGETVEVDALAAALADGADGRATGADRQRVAITLAHAHLPKLEAAGVVDYDPDRDRVAATPLLAVFEPYLDPAPDASSSESDRPAGDPVVPALAGLAGGGLATFLLLKAAGTVAVVGLALVVAVSAWWTATAR